ncbi:prepilin cleavage protein [Enterobacter sp. JBIWA003]|nr:prepilin cleavage protein [Enterobacter sp. JBIWA003]
MKMKKGFSLLELTLVLGVGTMVAFMKFQDMKNEQESIMASTVGQQMKQIGEAVNGYINIRYDKLSTLSNAAGTGTDPGPRTCSGSVCEITYQTLINEGLLPSTYTGTNANKSSYKIILKRDGTTPNFVINGLITTSTAWIEGGKTRYDLLGNAMQTAGIDSGMTRTTSNAFGYGGQWSETSANFNNITSAGQLAFRVGFNSALYSVYLRRDGTLPMTGDLNMGGGSISNADKISATGNLTIGGKTTLNDTLQVNSDINSTGSISSGNWLLARNGNGKIIRMGGDSNGDYDFSFEPTTSPVVGFFPSDSATKFLFNFRGDLGVSTPNGATRTVTIDSSTGNITSNGNISAGNWLVAHNGGGNTMLIGGDGGAPAADGTAGNDYEIKMDTAKPLTIWNTALSNDRAKTLLDVWGSQRILGNLNVSASNTATGDIAASGNITATGTMKADNFQPTSTAVVGEACNYNGAISRDAAGFTLSCQSSKWQRQFNPTVTLRDDGVWANSDFQACNSDEVVVGGGGQCEDPAHHYIHYSAPSNNGWRIDCFCTSPEYKDLGSRTYALCMKK